MEAIRRLDFDGMDLEDDGLDLEENAVPAEEQDTGHATSVALYASACTVKHQEARILELTSAVQRLKRRVRYLEGPAISVEEIISPPWAFQCRKRAQVATTTYWSLAAA